VRCFFGPSKEQSRHQDSAASVASHTTFGNNNNMVRCFPTTVFTITAAAAALPLSNVDAFLPASPNQAVNFKRETFTTLHAAPTMVIY
jgi:hypothetical protein